MTLLSYCFLDMIALGIGFHVAKNLLKTNKINEVITNINLLKKL